MISYNILPVINISNLENEMKKRFPENEKDFIDLRDTLFYADFMNDCLKAYGYWDDVVECDEYSMTERLVAKYLKDTFEPLGYREVIIDVSW